MAPDLLSVVPLRRYVKSYVCFTLFVGAGHVFTETPHFQVHFRATFFTLNDRAVITFNAEFALFDLVTVAGWVITTDMQLTFRSMR